MKRTLCKSSEWVSALCLGVAIGVLLAPILFWLSPMIKGLFSWSSEISYNDLMIVVSVFTSLFIFVKTAKQMKRDFERKGIFEFLNNSYIHKECVVNVSLFGDSGCVIRGGERILLRELRHEFLKLRDKEKNANWAEASAHLDPYTKANQVAFNLADNLELLGEALVAGWLPFDEVERFVGNNLVEDWLGCCHWVKVLRSNDQEGDKRVNGELIAYLAFLAYYRRNRKRPNRLSFLQKNYPRSFEVAYCGKDCRGTEQHGKSCGLELCELPHDLVQAELYVKSQVRKILKKKKNEFLDPDLKKKAEWLAGSIDRGNDYE